MLDLKLRTHQISAPALAGLANLAQTKFLAALANFSIRGAVYIGYVKGKSNESSLACQL